MDNFSQALYVFVSMLHVCMYVCVYDIYIYIYIYTSVPSIHSINENDVNVARWCLWIDTFNICTYSARMFEWVMPLSNVHG